MHGTGIYIPIHRGIFIHEESGRVSQATEQPRWPTAVGHGQNPGGDDSLPRNASLVIRQVLNVLLCAFLV